MEHIIVVDRVSKFYGKKVAVNQLSLQMPKGCIFGLLGPNGAGKTSLIRMITTITRADEGSIQLNGQALNSKHPQEIGYLPEERGLYKKMQVGEHLLYLAQLKGMSKKEATTAAKAWLERLELADRWKDNVENLSKGLQQQIQFIATVIHQPPLLILDEPFSGLDPINTNRLKDEIRRLNEEGTSIIFSTHRMEQVEEICEYIALVNNGQVVLEGEVNEVRERYKEHLFELVYKGDLPASFEQEFNIKKHKGRHLVLSNQAEQSANDLMRRILNTGVNIQSFSEILPSLNDIFIRIVGESNEAKTTNA